MMTTPLCEAWYPPRDVGRGKFRIQNQNLPSGSVLRKAEQKCETAPTQARRIQLALRFRKSSLDRGWRLTNRGDVPGPEYRFA